jgi:hypothetical protein
MATTQASTERDIAAGSVAAYRVVSPRLADLGRPIARAVVDASAVGAERSMRLLPIHMALAHDRPRDVM